MKNNYYRSEFLTSDKWKTLRTFVLARDNGMCQICGFNSVFNDVHHIHYPKSIWRTEVHHLVTLCRGCHDLVHSLFKEDMMPSRFTEIAIALRVHLRNFATAPDEEFFTNHATFHNVEKQECPVCKSWGLKVERRKVPKDGTYANPKSFDVSCCIECFESLMRGIESMQLPTRREFWGFFDKWKKSHKTS